ncbi:MAG TPA: hypothetical protein PKD86_01770, partial [Gemmatales bacterium]|nr:hypothetical protein [Gemmatales bacterium]
MSKRRSLILVSVFAVVAGTWGGWPASTPLQASFQVQPPATDPVASLPPAVRPVYVMGRRGAEWLAAMNRTDGLFEQGFNPAFNLPCEEEHYLTQVAATAALAQSARTFQAPAHAARAKQALLVLLAQTRVEEREPRVRLTQFPSASVNRAAAAAGLVLAIHAVPDPTPDLLEAAEQLAGYLRTLQTDEGHFRVEMEGLGPAAARTSVESESARVQGQIVQALAVSYGQAPAPWKLEAVRRAVVAQRSMWQGRRQMEVTYGMIAGCTELYERTKEAPFADCVFEMADWLASLQYGVEPNAIHFQGGFMSWTGGQPARTPPTLRSAAAIAALADACRTARLAGNVAAHDRARQACDRGIQFLAA